MGEGAARPPVLGGPGKGRARGREGDTAGGGAGGGDSVPPEGWNTSHLLACNTIRINWYSVRGRTQTQKCKPSTSFLISPPQDPLRVESFGRRAGWRWGQKKCETGGGAECWPAGPVGISVRQR